LLPLRRAALLLVVAASLLSATLGAAARAAEGGAAVLENTPFWRDSAGWWASDNTYLDGRLQQNISAYQGITHFELVGRRVVETSHRFYPPGKSSNYYGQGIVADDEGIELITITVMEAIDDRGTVRAISVSPRELAPAGQMTTTPLSSSVALQQVLDESQLASYHTLITLPTPGQRYTAMFGIHTGGEGSETDAGALRGLALFAGRRIGADQVRELRAQFRQRNAVAAIVRGDADGKLSVEPIDRPHQRP
jgi:hypothetical protein